MLRRLAATFAFAAAALGPRVTGAQQPQAAPPTWAFATSLGIQQSTGSTTSIAVTGEQDIADTTGTQQFSLAVTGAYSRTRYSSPVTGPGGAIVGTVKRAVISRRYGTDYSDRIFIDQKPYVALRAQWERDDNQGIARRVFFAGGGGVRWIADKRQSFATDLTFGRLYERDQRSASENYPAASFVATENVRYGKEGGGISFRFEHLQNLTDRGDVLRRGHVGVLAPLTAHVGLSVSYDATHDTRPSAGIFDADASDDVVTQPTRYNGNLSVALSVSW